MKNEIYSYESDIRLGKLLNYSRHIISSNINAGDHGIVDTGSFGDIVDDGINLTAHLVDQNNYYIEMMDGNYVFQFGARWT